MEPCCKMRTQDCLLFRNSILELMLIKIIPQCCCMWMLLFGGSTMTKIWEPGEIVTPFLQRSPVIFLICDSIELRLTQHWEMRGLTGCLHATNSVTVFIRLLFYLDKSAMLSHALSKKVEPNNWEAKGSGLYRKQVESRSFLLQSQPLVWGNCVVNIVNRFL